MIDWEEKMVDYQFHVLTLIRDLAEHGNMDEAIDGLNSLILNMYNDAKRELRWHITNLMINIIKCKELPDYVNSSWLNDIWKSQFQVEWLLKEHPEFREIVSQYISEDFPIAKSRAERTIGITLPSDYPVPTENELFEDDSRVSMEGKVCISRKDLGRVIKILSLSLRADEMPQSE